LNYRKYLATLNYDELLTINLKKSVRDHIGKFSEEFDVTKTYKSVFKHMLKVMQG
jgi:hypothetical protein